MFNKFSQCTSPLLKFKHSKCITNHSHINLENGHIKALIDDTFALFKSVNNEFLLIYSFY